MRWIQRNFWTTCCTQIAKNSSSNQGPSRICSEVLHGGGQLGYCWQQHPHLLHQVYVWILSFHFFYEYKLRFLTWALNACTTNQITGTQSSSPTSSTPRRGTRWFSWIFKNYHTGFKKYFAKQRLIICPKLSRLRWRTWRTPTCSGTSSRLCRWPLTRWSPLSKKSSFKVFLLPLLSSPRRWCRQCNDTLIPGLFPILGSWNSQRLQIHERVQLKSESCKEKKKSFL